ncbi:UTP--glucose-1-phosphate uridylyltransferase [Arsenicicoccus sp. oral taxon 190]|uniref:UTP--glucose-1-phosphate uridylyltransferase n=1 Tax=Arsenicicoccus sp. oral taxon 190 TaxID=1658671 RepID=UPI00067A148E|nr:UTP--glucose-1-phosphate uridylyltransferase [Arsenicicoccus sp. oral taxon 190]AKT52443.1 UTP--glucose-1-phosphate uridylyltransferase [Arsenicicoccus sp. oral taxon 190]
MSHEGLARAKQVMTDAGVNPTAIEVFSHYYGELEAGKTGVIREDSIRPLTDPPTLESADVDEETAREALARTVIIKLNGGLGTSMGMARAKSLLPVREGKSFLDIVVQQVLAARERYGVRLPLLLMDSFNTQADTLAALERYPDLPVEDLPLDFLQSQEPKLRTDDLAPVEWPADPHLEWCPPGHGDLYPSLLSSGILEALLDKGFRYATVSNGDNLGAAPDARLAGWFASSGAPYAAEVCRRTAMDRKGGHLAIRVEDDQLILRDTAQTAEEEMDFFTDEHRHPFFHTNNLWLDLQRLHDVLTERDGVLGLPLIRNVKTVDPKDPSSPEVYQVESAMGAAVEVFEGAQAIAVPRTRFLPVKTTNELMLLRSDVYDLREDGTLQMQVDKAPVVSLDSAHFKKIGDFEQRVPGDVPSLRDATALTVEGDWTFGDRVVVQGAVTLPDEGEARRVEDGTVLRG